MAVKKGPFTLPVLQEALASARQHFEDNPTVDSAREKLGGRVQTEADVGQLVEVPGAFGLVRTGVVICRIDDEADVWLGAGRVQRTRESLTLASSDDADPDLLGLAADAKVFAALNEGQRVLFVSGPSSQPTQGLLVEKCRYGGLVWTDDEKVVAVGFRQLVPQPG